MDKKLTMVAIVCVAVLIAVGGVLIGRYVLGPGSSSKEAMLLDEKTKELENKDHQIGELEKQAEALRKDLDESAKQVTELQSRLDQTNQGLASMQEKLKKTRVPQVSQSASASGSGVSPTDAGSYEVNRATSVFQEASTSSRKITTIAKGTKVNVVRSVGDWLEVRSKHGNPPGYIRREDATYMGPN